MRHKLTLNGALILVCISLLVLAYPLKLCFHTVMFPELHSQMLRNKLECDINSGDELAIEYYQSKYLDNGIVLFD